MSREEVRMELHVPLSRFLTMVSRGQFGSASGGEQRAYRLAKAIVDDVPGLDEQAVDGLLVFILLASCHPTSAEELLAMSLLTRGGRRESQP